MGLDDAMKEEDVARLNVELAEAAWAEASVLLLAAQEEEKQRIYLYKSLLGIQQKASEKVLHLLYPNGMK